MEKLWDIIRNNREDRRAAISQMTFFQTNTTGDEGIKGEATLRLAYLHLGQGNRDDAERYFKEVASGNVASTLATRHEAAMRYARMRHSNQDRPAAYETIRSVLANNPGPAVEADARREMGGLLMEFAHSGHGTYADCRAFYDESLRAISAEFTKDRATITLMSAESLYYEGLLEESIGAFSQLIGEYGEKPDTGKFIAMALTFKGVARWRLGDHDAGYATIERVLDLELTARDRWGSIRNPKEHALAYLTSLAYDAGDIARFRDYRTQLEVLRNER